jgi:hypothetical protein
VSGKLFTLKPAAKTEQVRSSVDDHPGEWGLVAAGWLLAGVPICWGLTKTVALVSQMFQ